MEMNFRVMLMTLAAAVPLATPPPAMAADVPPLDCLLEPNQVIDLSSSIRGTLESVDVDRGDLVEQGQVVAKLDSSVEQAALDLARARAQVNSQVQAERISAEFAQRRSQRVGTLYGQSAISGDQFDETKTSAQLRELQLQQAQENRRLAQLEARQAQEILKRHIVRSPVRGVVVHRYLSPGESAEDRPILRIAEVQVLRAETIIPVALFGSVKVGQKAVIVPEAPLTGYYEGTVAVVDRVADAASGTFRARVMLPNPNYALPSGLRCSVRFLQPGESVAQNVPPPPASRPMPRSLSPRLRSPAARELSERISQRETKQVR
jgi:RND family efflux transporter MFP subunit